MKYIIRLFLLMILLSNISYADSYELKGEQLKIFQQTISGEINQKMHNRFWSLVPKKDMNSILKNKDKFDKFLNESILLAFKFQQEIWKSIRVSYLEKQVFKTDLYREYKSMLKLKPYAKKAIENAEGLLKSASKRTGYNSQRGVIYPNDTMSDKILINLEQIFFRSSKLFNPVWEK